MGMGGMCFQGHGPDRGVVLMFSHTLDTHLIHLQFHACTDAKGELRLVAALEPRFVGFMAALEGSL